MEARDRAQAEHGGQHAEAIGLCFKPGIGHVKLGDLRESRGAFLDSIEGEPLYALFALPAYFGLRRSGLAGLCWADADLAARHVHVSQAQVDDELNDTKSEDSDRIITIDLATADVLRAWRKAQLAERMA
jgi:integrase